MCNFDFPAGCSTKLVEGGPSRERSVQVRLFGLLPIVNDVRGRRRKWIHPGASRHEMVGTNPRDKWNHLAVRILLIDHVVRGSHRIGRG